MLLQHDLATAAPALSAATVLLALQAAGGAGAIIAGGAALTTRKGGPGLGLAANAILASMSLTIALALGLAVMLAKPGEAFAAAIALYLTVSGWLTARRGPPPGMVEIYAMLFGFAAGAGSLWFGLAAIAGGTAGRMAIADVGLGLVAIGAAGLDLRLILGAEIGGAARTARHLWRVGVALLMAGAGFYLGQQRAMSPAPRDAALLAIAELAIVACLAAGLVRAAVAQAVGGIGTRSLGRSLRAPASHLPRPLA